MDVLYLNGLGDGRLRRRETMAIRYLERRGHRVTHGHVDWYEQRLLASLVREKEIQARRLVNQKGKLAIVGSSAGVSLAFNVMAALGNRSGAYAVGMCGRIRPGEVPDWDWRTLHNMAHMGTNRESKLFYASVNACPKSIDALGRDRSRLTIITQITDMVVPPSARTDPRIETVQVAGLGHAMGIAMAVTALPEILSELESRPN